MSEIFEEAHDPEPEWILDENGHGHLYWRRDAGNRKNFRVKFKHDVEIKEFQRAAHELLEPEWVHYPDSDQAVTNSIFNMSVTCFVCITVSVIIPWYIIMGTRYY